VDLRYAVSAALRRALNRPAERDFQLMSLLRTKPGEAFCDIGCNRGQSIDSFLMFNKSCQIVAFEPNPVIFTKARSRFEGNAGITIHNVGLSAERTSKTLYVPKYRNTYFDELASFDCGSAENWFFVNRIIGLDRKRILFEEFECKLATLDDYPVSPAIIKIDVQGYETQVIQGAWSTITRCRPILLIENDDRHSATNVMRQVSKLDYVPYRFDGEKLRRNDFGAPNTFYMVTDFERGLDRVVA
jgi:FkbM family methyltransferase